jgi:hypothetical protein
MAEFSTRPVSRDEYHEMIADGWSEDQLLAKVIKLAETLGWLAYHTHDSRRSQAGYPDLHLVHPVFGLSLFRELKKQKRAYLRPDQKVWLAALENAGFDCGVWRPLDYLNGSIRAELELTARKAPSA